MADDSTNTSLAEPKDSRQTFPPANDPGKTSKTVLDPPERISEVLFGLIMVLTFTCSFSVAGANRGEVRNMLLGALGCNFAWGIIDGFFYLMSCLSERGHNLATLRALRETAEPKQVQRILADALPAPIVAVMREKEFEALRLRLNQLPEPPAETRLTRDDWQGAFGVMLLVVLSTFPPTVPFIFLGNLRLALRISNGVAIVLLFLLGHAYGRYAGQRPWRWAVSMVVLGSAMVGLTIALGG